MPRRRSLSRDEIVGAALAVIDREQVAGLTMRAVSAELGTSAMALYRYVDSREQLEQSIVEYVLNGVDLTLRAEIPWQEKVAVLMERARDAIIEHPAAVPLLLAHRHASLASLRWIETMLTVLSEAGFSGAELPIAQRSLVSYLVGSLYTQHLGPLAGSGTAAMAALPETTFPHVTYAADQARHLTPRQEFRGGLAIVLGGLQPEPHP